MRLLDKLLSESFDVGSADRNEVLGLLGNAQLVVADNVRNYIEEFKAKDLPTANDFPNVMLPFEHTFIEANYPRSSRIGTVVESGGILLNMTNPSGFIHPDERMNTWLHRPEVAWHLNSYVFFSYRGRSPVLRSRLILPVGHDGSTMSERNDGRLDIMTQHLQLQEGSVMGSKEHDAAVGSIILVPALMTLSFMHCRNVTMAKESPPLPLSRKYERRTGRLLLRYHVLKIDHMKNVLEREGHASTDGLRKALHICRGHFKHYGRDGKGLLFGKHVATVWIPMHTRGNIEEGAVIKDYEVK